ncbi:MAG: hypothetical protein FWG77_06190 [Treponema sp.]|nr:hypothetical protein [Treponema sp.]
MGFFTEGNLITLGIVLLVLILYRQMDRKSRSPKLLRDYSERLKTELGAFVKEQENAVRDYSVSLNVERDSAKELMKRLNEKELTEKARLIDRMDSQIKSYESSLSELDKMTARVQENMNRVREESDFVESTGKRLIDVKTRLEEYEKRLGGLEDEFERENSIALERTADGLVDGVKSTVSDLIAVAETIERKVEDHREIISEIEKNREANLSRDTEAINKLLAKAVEQAGKRAEKMEDSALAILKEQAEDRIRKLKAGEEEKLQAYQENAKARVTEVQNLIKGIKEEWRADRSAWDEKDKAYITEMKSVERRMEELFNRTGEMISAQEESIRKSVESLNIEIQNASEDMKQNANEIAVRKFEEYRSAQDAEFKRLESIADASRKLDEELRRNMQEAMDRVQEDFHVFRQESKNAQKLEFDKFNSTAASLRNEIIDTEKELTNLKNTAQENITEKLKTFEVSFNSELQRQAEDIDKRLMDWQENHVLRLSKMTGEVEAARNELEHNLTSDLSKRTHDIDKRLMDWKEGHDSRLSKMTVDSEAALNRLEQSLGEEIRKALLAQNERIISDMEQLKTGTTAFEEGIRAQMSAAGESIASLKNHFEQNINEAKKEAELTIGRYRKIKAAEDEKLSSYHESAKARVAEVKNLVKSIREEWRAERSAWDEKDKALLEEHKKEITSLNSLFGDSEKRLSTDISSMENRLHQLLSRAAEMITGQEESLKKAVGDIGLEIQRAAEDMKQKALEITEQKLEEYQSAQAAQFMRLETLSDDAGKLDEELRRSMQEAVEKIQADFSLFRQNSENAQKTEFDKFVSSIAGIKKEIQDTENDLNVLKGLARENISDKLKQFEEGFGVNLASVTGGIDKRLADWQAAVDTRLAGMATDAEAALGELENKLGLEIRKTLSSGNEKIISDMEDIKAGIVVFEEGIRSKMNVADQSMASLKEQFERRIAEAGKEAELSIDQFKKIKEAEKAELYKYHEDAKTRVSEIKSLIKSIKDEWKEERAVWDEKDRALIEQHKKEVQALDLLYSDSQKRFGMELTATEKKLNELLINAGEMIKLQEENFKVDAGKIDEELRRNMLEAMEKVQGDFSLFKQEFENAKNTETEKFSDALGAIRKDVAETENELTVLKKLAEDNINEKLKVFEDNFVSDLAERAESIDKRFHEWQQSLDRKLNGMARDAETARNELDKSLGEETRKILSAQNEKILSDMEELKTETMTFEEGIRNQMNIADESMAALREQLEKNISEIKTEAELAIKSELGRHSIAAAEDIKQYQHEFDARLHEISQFIDKRNTEINSFLDASKAEVDGERNGLAIKIRELSSIIDDARRRVNDFSDETDDRITTVRSSIDEVEKHIVEAVAQANKAEETRRDIDRRIEVLRGDMDRLDQRKAETAQLENEFLKIKRLNDEVNNKMTRFFSEKRRIDNMEGEFNKLIKISRKVEDKLVSVSSSDDVIQAIQLQIRKLEEAMEDAENRYLQMERKSQILDNTNEGIDNNFKVLQDSEKLSAKISMNLERYAEDIDTIKTSIEALSKESDRAREAVERIDILDNALDEVEARIKSVDRARRWIAEAESRLEDLNRQAQTQARAIDSMISGSTRNPGQRVELGEGAPSMQKKETVLTLLRQGWTKEEIAKNMKISLGEVELISELPGDLP